LVTVVILGTLSAIAVPGFLDYQKEGVAAANNAEAMALAKTCTAGMATPGAQLTTPCTTSGGTFPSDKAPAKATPASVTVNANGDITVASKSVKK
jgi:type II secretory pathway pseudopilin PulG